jgi:hypothetical protein
LHRYLYKILLLTIIVCTTLCKQNAQAQITIKGTVYNMYRTKPLEAVSVSSTSGKGTLTDSAGNYSIVVTEHDSLSFSYLGRTTVKFPVSSINSSAEFDIALHVDPTELKPLQVMPKNYHLDSLQNRQDYAKAFNYKKPGVKITDGSNGLGAGFDLDELINMFRFNRNRRMLAFQKRLVEEEHDKFIDHRFTAYLVKKLTHFTSPELDSFMVKYRPSYYFTETSSDYDFGEYIKLAAKEYKEDKNHSGEMRKEEEKPVHH